MSREKELEDLAIDELARFYLLVAEHILTPENPVTAKEDNQSARNTV